MDQQIEVLDLGLLVRTFAQELILPEVALQLKYEIPKLPEKCWNRPRGASC